MVFSVSPSVTVREVDLTSNIPAIASNQGAIAGVFNWGPVGEVTFVTSEAELVDVFGKPSDNNYETFFTAADFLAYSNQLFVVRVDNGAAVADASLISSNAASYDFEAKYAGSIGNAIAVSYVTGNNEFSQILLEPGQAANPANTDIFNSNIIHFQAEIDLSSVINVGDIIVLGNDSVGYQNLVLTDKNINPVANTSTYDYTLTFATKYTLAETSIANLKIARKWGYSYIVERAPAPGTIHIIVADKTGEITGVAGTILERYTDLSLSATGKTVDGVPNYYRTIINDSSNWVRIPDDSADIVANQVGYLDFANGTDGVSESSVSFGSLAAAYDLFNNTEQFDIAFIMQGKAVNDSTNLANYIISNVVDARKDCVLFVSPSRDTVLTGNNVKASRNEIVSDMIMFRNALQSSSYWFMDTGYKYRFDKYNNTFRWVPLNGDMAGLAARIDPWESPAGYKRGIIKNVTKLAFNPNKAERDRLYGSDINSVISQAGQGTLLFGDKTGLGRSSAFDRINVRRLFIVVEKAIATVSASLLFDFNDEFTQTEFNNLVDPLLRDIKGRRGITDFRVISDGRVNTPDVIDRNIFRANIFIKPARTINYIELTFIATRTGISFEELIGQQF
jgi:hypothetical protein